MKNHTPSQLRRRYLDFLVAAGHAEIPSASLVPENDPTTLFTSSGMQPLVPYLLGQPHPKGVRLVNSQKCFRANDIDEVGDNRHTTYFEMLGNWSLGDYFKKDQLRFFFTFLTKELGLEPKRLFVTVYRGNDELGVPRDTESVEIWKTLFKEADIAAEAIDFAERDGMQGGRIFFYDDKKNWWSRAGVPGNMPVGEPGGPDSEVFYDFGEELELHPNSPFADEPCHVNCDCGRFLEIGNSVFMQYQKQADGSFKELPQQNVDFGGGFERLLAAQAQDPDVFNTGIFQPIIKAIEEMSHKPYIGNEKAFRIIADHARASVMLAADGVIPGNKEQGYFLRRLLRRAILYGNALGIHVAFMKRLVDAVTVLYADSDYWDSLSRNSKKITELFEEEELKFRKTLVKGLKEFERLVNDTLTAADAFRLYESYGFPFELSVEETQKRDLKVEADLDTKFAELKTQHSTQSRSASAGKFKGGLADHSEITVKYHTATHLLHAALRQFLGEEVKQKGSNITAERLRFDFSFHRALTEAEKKQVEDQINAWTKLDLPVTRQVLPKEEALKSGAIAFFDNYPDEVSVYTVGVNVDGPAHTESGWISKEFCGGPHVTHLGEIGALKLVKEQAVAAGTRRIYIELA